MKFRCKCNNYYGTDVVIFSIIIFTNPSTQARYDTRSIFKQSCNRFEFRVFLSIMINKRFKKDVKNKENYLCPIIADTFSV